MSVKDQVLEVNLPLAVCKNGDIISLPTRKVKYIVREMIPLPGEEELLDDFLLISTKSKVVTCHSPTKIIVLHVPISELPERIEHLQKLEAEGLVLDAEEEATGEEEEPA